MFPEKCVSLDKLHVILLCHPDIEDTLVVSPRPLGLLYDGSKGVGEVFEQKVLLLHVHAQDPVEELAHLVVSLVQGQHPGAVLTGGDQTNSNKAVSDV